MENETPVWLSLVFSWAPFAVIAGIFVLFMLRNQRIMGGNQRGDNYIDLMKAQISEVQRMNVNLEKLLEKMDHRIASLEDRTGR